MGYVTSIFVVSNIVFDKVHCKSGKNLSRVNYVETLYLRAQAYPSLACGSFNPGSSSATGLPATSTSTCQFTAASK